MANEVRTENCVLVGVPLPQPVFDYLSLYALISGQTKAAIVRQLITSWHSAKSTTSHPEKLLLEKLFNQFRVEMETRQTSNPLFNKSEHISELRKVLKKKGLNESAINYLTNL